MADELICIERQCRHARRMHSIHGCLFPFKKGQCFCSVVYTDKEMFQPGRPVTSFASGGTVGIDEILGTLNEANLKASEVRAALTDLMAVLRNAGMDMEEVINLNAAATGSAQPQSLVSAAHLFVQVKDSIELAYREIESAEPNLAAGIENHNEMIGRLSA